MPNHPNIPPVKVSEPELIQRLQRPDGMVDVVLDTDTYNEIDDQYALAYLLLNPEKANVKAIYAAPFSNEKAATPEIGMRKSHDEIMNILQLMGREDMMQHVYEGSTEYLPDESTPVMSPAAGHLVKTAMAHTPEQPLYVIALAAITNVSSALLIEPAIRDRIVVVWLGGQALHWHDNYEFNLRQDIAAARVLMGCGAAVVLVPCKGVVSAFSTTEPELREHLKGHNPLCDYLYSYTTSEVSGYKGQVKCWSKPIWDVTAVGWLLSDQFMLDELIPSPIPEYDHRWGQDKRRHLIRYVYHINRDKLFEDLFHKLASCNPVQSLQN